MQPITVRQLNLYVKSLLDGDRKLSDITVIGEISNFKNHYSSGHWYFTLKDKDASIRCVMFKMNADRVKFRVCDGMQVIIRGRTSVYEKDGQYQFYSEEMYSAGEGDISLAFEQTKAKLAAEGLFDAENKRKLPDFPKRIVVITSDTGAAIQDILNITSRRYPICDIIVCPVLVQGELAVRDMVDTLSRIKKLSDIDLIIIGRGGGSVEDLWAFNSELLARKIYESAVPVISAVGHETDFTICDFVADLRAPTPSAAAEIAVPDSAEILQSLAYTRSRLTAVLKRRYEFDKTRFETLKNSSALRNPKVMLQKHFQQLDHTVEQLQNVIDKRLELCKNKFLNLTSRFESVNPIKVMARGFAVAQKDGKVIRSATELVLGDAISVTFAKDNIKCLVEEINDGNKKT